MAFIPETKTQSEVGRGLPGVLAVKGVGSSDAVIVLADNAGLRRLWHTDQEIGEFLSGACRSARTKVKVAVVGGDGGAARFRKCIQVTDISTKP